MANSRIFKTVVTAAASLFLMPVANLVSSFPNQGFASPAFASTPKPVKTSSQQSYVPPHRGTPRRTQGTGSRGCTQSQPVALSLLIPSDHTAQTVSGHPTFFWYVSAKPAVPVEIALVEPGVAKPIFVQQMQLPKAGVNSFAMPKKLPELGLGKEYRWSVTLICNTNRRSNDTFAQGWIKRVPETPELKQQLSAANIPADRASVYARAGLWYNALNTLSADLSTRENFLALLDQVGLREVVLQERQNLASK